MKSLMSTALSVFLTFVLVLIGARFFALLVDANRESEIVERIYRHSDFWVKPFFGMFNFENEVVGATGGVFEPASLIAFLVYLIGGMIVLALLGGAAFRRLTHV